MKNKTKELSNVDVALYALYKLGGIAKHIHTEDIAWESYQLAKERFSWRLSKFREKGFPDKTPVRFALEQAKKKENGQLISGRAGGDAGGELEGWSFTQSGVRWIKENEQRIVNLLNEDTLQVPKREADRFIKRIKSDPLFKHYEQNKHLDQVQSYMFTDMLVCAPDASKNIIKKKFEQLSSTAELIGKLEIIVFLKACHDKFMNFLL